MIILFFHSPESSVECRLKTSARMSALNFLLCKYFLCAGSNPRCASFGRYTFSTLVSYSSCSFCRSSLGICFSMMLIAFLNEFNSCERYVIMFPVLPHLKQETVLALRLTPRWLLASSHHGHCVPIQPEETFFPLSV